MQMTRMTRLFIAASLVVLASGCATRNMLNDGSGGKAMLAGNDPVSYHTGPAPIKGDPAITAAWDGGTYRFANADNRDLFTKSPEKYAPQYGGYCATGTAFGKKVPIDPSQFKIVEGKLYLNNSAGAAKVFNSDVPGMIAKANKQWITIEAVPADKL